MDFIEHVSSTQSETEVLPGAGYTGIGVFAHCSGQSSSSVITRTRPVALVVSMPPPVFVSGLHGAVSSLALSYLGSETKHSLRGDNSVSCC